jgi:hypothetical protein
MPIPDDVLLPHQNFLPFIFNPFFFAFGKAQIAARPFELARAFDLGN